MQLNDYDPGIRLLSVSRRVALCRWPLDNVRVVFWRLYWNAGAGAEIQFQNRRIGLLPNRLTLVPPYTEIKKCLVHGPVRHWYAHFLAGPPFDRVRDHVYTFPANQTTMRRVFALTPGLDEPVSDAIRLSLATRALVCDVLARIPPGDLRHMPEIPDLLAASLAYVEANLNRPLGNREIARQMGVCINAMLRHYRDGVGFSPQGYVRLKRVEQASILLHDPRRSIKEIAAETGFYDRYHFSRVFKAMHGVTPLCYRRQFEV